MNPLALPYLPPDADQATRSAVAAGMNGVTAELRGHALRKIRAAIRRKALSPARVARAVAGGDAGLASLFPVGKLPGPPSIPASSLPKLSSDGAFAETVARSTWFIDLALRRNCAPDGLLDTLTDPTTAPSVSASLLLDTWNRLLESYRPDWLPASMSSERPLLLALPGHLSRWSYEDYYGEDTGRVMLKITPAAISRLLVDQDAPGFAALYDALLALDKATLYPLIAADPIEGRDYYNAYMHPEFYEDLRHHVVWPEGASEPVADIDAIAVLIEESGYDASDADHYAALACKDAIAKRLRTSSGAATAQADDAPDSAFARIATQVRDITAHLAAMPTPPQGKCPCGGNAGYPVRLVATYEHDPAYRDLVEAIDMECQEGPPSMSFGFPKKPTPSALDSHLGRIVVEMLVADCVYGLITDTFEDA